MSDKREITYSLRFFWLASLFMFLFYSIYIYGTMPASVAMLYDEEGSPIQYVNKDLFYFTSVFIFMVFNLMVSYFQKKVQAFKLFRIKDSEKYYWFQSEEKYEKLIRVVRNSVYTFALALNFTFGMYLMVICRVNTEMGLRISDFLWLGYFVPAVVLFLLAYLFTQVWQPALAKKSI